MLAVPGFPGGSGVKNPPSNAADVGLIPSPEDFTWHRATIPMSHNSWACALRAMSPNYRSPWDPTTEAHGPQLPKPMGPNYQSPWDPTTEAHGTQLLMKPMGPNYWWSPWDPTTEAHGTQLLKPMGPNYWSPCVLGTMLHTRGATSMRNLSTASRE